MWREKECEREREREKAYEGKIIAPAAHAWQGHHQGSVVRTNR